MKKFNAFLKIAFAFLFACVISITFMVEQAMATGYFSRNCSEVDIFNSYLITTCTKDDNTDQTNFLDLDEYIGVSDNGQLTWESSNLSKSCKDLGLGQLLNRDYVLNAKCLTKDGTYVQTDINLDEHFTNINGKLKFES
ncbi:MAG: cyanovirin [Okeania sp. SIO2D1]|nr:cyanovirin [Okeania sp. SIO2D1]